MSRAASSPTFSGIDFRTAFQAALPSGLELRDPFDDGLPTSESFCARTFRAEDHRGGLPAEAWKCIVSWLPLTQEDEQDWLPELLRRCKILAESGLPELVSLAPLEIGRLELPGIGRGLYVLGRPFASTLADQILPAKKLPKGVIDALSRELAPSLAALHRLGIAHGAIGPRQIRLSSAELNGTTHAWLGGVVTGHLPEKTGNRLVFPDQEKYQLALSAGVPKFSPPADVHQFLLTMAEAQLGTAVFAKSKTLSALVQNITDSRCSRWLSRGISVANQKNSHWEDGKRLQQEVTRGFQWHLWRSVTEALLIVVFVLGLGWQRQANRSLERQVDSQNKQIVELNQEIGKFQSEKRHLEETLEEKDIRIAGLEDELRRPPPPPTPDAKDHWENYLADWPVDQKTLEARAGYQELSEESRQNIQNWNSILQDFSEAHTQLKTSLAEQENAVSLVIEEYRQNPGVKSSPPYDMVIREFWKGLAGNLEKPEQTTSIGSLAGQLPVKSSVRDGLSQYVKLLHDRVTLRTISQRWPESKEIQNIVKKNLHAPWDSSIREELERLDKELQSAYEIWSKWTASATSWEHLRRQVKEEAEVTGNKNLEARVSKQILLVEKKNLWFFAVTDGGSPTGYGRYRKLYMGDPSTVIVGYAGVGFITETWSSDTQRLLPGSGTFHVQRSRGEPIQCVLYTDRSFYKVGARPYILNETIGGPFPLWKILVKDNGKVVSRDGKTWVRLMCLDFEEHFPKPHTPPQKPAK